MPYYSIMEYTGNGSQTDYAVTYPYLAQAHVKAYIDDVPTAFTWVNGGTIRFASPPGGGTAIKIRRETPYADRLVDFQAGSILSERDLNTSVKQIFFALQELQESAVYMRGIQGEPGDTGATGPQGDQGPAGPGPWTDLNDLLTDLTGQLNSNHLDTLTKSRIDYIDNWDGFGSPLYGAVEGNTVQSINQSLSEYEARINDNYTAIGLVNIDLDATQGSITTLGLVIQSGEYGWVMVTGLTGTFVDGETINCSGGGSAKYSIIGSTSTKLYCYGVVDPVNFAADVSDVLTGVTSGATATVTAVYTSSEMIDRVFIAEEKLSAAELQWTVKLEYNAGYGGSVIAGIGLFIDEETASSDFIVFADNFAVVNQTAGGNFQYPFIIGTVAGEGSKVGINGDLVVDGTIRANSIKANEILTSKLYVGENKITLDGTANKITVSDGTYERVSIGKYDASNYGLQMKDASGNITFEQSSVMKNQYMKIDTVHSVNLFYAPTWPWEGDANEKRWTAGAWNGQLFVGNAWNVDKVLWTGLTNAACQKLTALTNIHTGTGNIAKISIANYLTTQQIVTWCDESLGLRCAFVYADRTPAINLGPFTVISGTGMASGFNYAHKSAAMLYGTKPGAFICYHDGTNLKVILCEPTGTISSAATITALSNMGTGSNFWVEGYFVKYNGSGTTVLNWACVRNTTTGNIYKVSWTWTNGAISSVVITNLTATSGISSTSWSVNSWVALLDPEAYYWDSNTFAYIQKLIGANNDIIYIFEANTLVLTVEMMTRSWASETVSQTVTLSDAWGVRGYNWIPYANARPSSGHFAYPFGGTPAHALVGMLRYNKSTNASLQTILSDVAL